MLVQYLVDKELIKPVSTHNLCKIYTRAGKA
jgi:hypothetical protein